MKLKCMCVMLLLFPNLGLASSFGTLDGRYDMVIEIKGKIFHDILEIRGKDKPIIREGFFGPIEGSLTVPNAFTSPLTGRASCSAWIFQCSLTFSIIADENGQTYKVNYKGRSRLTNERGEHIAKPAVITGEAYLEDDSLLGKFTATEIVE